MTLVPIVGVNLLVFLAMVVSTGVFDWDAETLADWGANYGGLTLHGQWWRLLTSQYLHANAGHIIGNMVLLMIVGAYVEAKVKPIRFLLAYTVCGVAAGLLSAFGNPGVVAVGASGAIAGIVGILVVLYASGRAPEISGKWVAQTVGINAIYSLAPNVDWLAHLGGFGAGLAYGGALVGFSILPALRDTPD